jgi:hypothetical protein
MPRSRWSCSETPAYGIFCCICLMICYHSAAMRD